MMDRFKTVLVALPACLLITATMACGDGNGGQQDDTAREITNEQLAQMVLALADFGPEYGAFTPSEENGAQTLEDRVDEDIEPEAEREDLTKFRWTSGFDQTFFSAEAVQQLNATFLVASGLDLYENADDASAYFKDNESESEDAVGKGDEDGAITAVETFSVDVADDSVGWIISGVTDENQSFWVLLVTVRKGRLIGEVCLGGTGEIPAAQREQLIEKSKNLAATLDGRIASVLAAAPEAAAEQ